LQKEIMEALCRLEQTGENNNDNDKSATSQYMSVSSNTTDRSCLRQLR
jgi:hypothetical protein